MNSEYQTPPPIQTLLSDFVNLFMSYFCPFYLFIFILGGGGGGGGLILLIFMSYFCSFNLFIFIFFLFLSI